MRHARIPALLLGLAVALGAAGAAAAAVPADGGVAAHLRDEADGDLKDFYAARDWRPLWIAKGRIGPAADRLIAYLADARLDGLRPGSYDVDDLREAVRAARSGEPAATARAELALSAAFARYVRDMRRPGEARMTYADPSLRPRKAKPAAILRAAAFPPSLDAYLRDMGWMSPLYVRIRRLMADADGGVMDESVRDRLRLNLDRARLLPGPWTSHVVVDASSARLWYYQAGEERGTMRVVVGAEATQTPMLAGTLQWAILNPYWNVPTYLARQSIAPKILSGRTLPSMRIEALSDWSPAAQTIDPATIDWAGVAAGEREVRLRELPGGANSMGRVKFLFPNDEGIYLHDTPRRDLFAKADRHLSNGCIRLEKASELGRWLLQKPVTTKSKTPEQAVPLPVQVPVYLTYLTAAASDGGLIFREDVYGRD